MLAHENMYTSMNQCHLSATGQVNIIINMMPVSAPVLGA